MSKSSLQKSHSVTSNFKLTLVCLLLGLFTSGIWASLFMFNFLPQIYCFIALGVSSVGTLLFLFVLSRFKR